MYEYSVSEEPVTRPTLYGMSKMHVQRTGHQANLPEIDGQVFCQKARIAGGDLNVNSSNIRTECVDGMLL